MAKCTTKKITGMYWHVYHDSLLDYCYDYDGRLQYIEKYKFESEQKLRICLFKLVQHPELLPPALADVQTTYGSRSLLSKQEKEQVDRRHEIECPNCPWNGKTIFITRRRKLWQAIKRTFKRLR